MSGALQTRFSRLERALTGVVVVLSGIFLTFLLQQSVFLTTQDTHSIDTGYTRGFYTADPAPWAHLLVFVLLAALAWLLARRPAAARERGWRLLKRLALPVSAAMLALWVWLAAGCRMEPVDDAVAVWRCAQQLLAGDASCLGPGGYLDMCPNHLFLTLYDMAFLALFGPDRAAAATQAANALWLLLAVWFMAAALGVLSAMPRRRGAYVLVLAVWLPMGLYTTFMYGTLPGLAMSAVQIWAMAHVLAPGGAAGRAGWVLLTAAAGALAALFKQNYLIVSVAICLYLGWQALRAATGRRSWPERLLPLAGIAVTLLLYTGANSLLSTMLYDGTGFAPGGGRPITFWLALGMQDIDAAEGWIGAQEGGAMTEIYCTQGKAAADAYCRQDIRTRLAEFRADPAMMLRFYARKTTSQWNMPTFQSLDTNRNREMVPRGVRWAEELLAVGGRLEPLYLLAADLLLTQLWAWALVNLLLRRRTLRPEDVFFYVVFLGGFVFHLFWEAKAQYTLVYAFLLLPCALDGWCAFGRWAAQQPAPKAAARTLWPAALAVLFLIVSGASGNYLSCTRAEAAGDLAVYAVWRAEQTPDLPEGVHLIYPASSDVPLSVDMANEGAHLSAVPGRQTAFTLLPLHDRLLLDSVPQTQACQILLAPENAIAIGMSSSEGALFASQKGRPDPFAWTQQWLLLPTDGGALWALCILDIDGNYLALTDDGGGTLSLQPYDARPAQFWRIVLCAQ